MAATLASVSITRIPADATASENKSFSGISASSSAFVLQGGKYQVSCVASTYGTVALSVLSADGSTFLPSFTAFAANGVQVIDLGQGQYKVVLA
jgi:hypothetical protein